MEPLSHYHYEICCCKPVPINLHQITCTNILNHASTMHQPVPQPVINLYHKQVHQPCTNLYQTTCAINKCINHAPTCTSTCTMNKCINHVTNLYKNNLSQQLVQTTYHNNLSHQYYQPNQIYSPRSITKTTLKDVHQPSITQQLIIITKINMFF
jgi:hypothetical protein